MNNQLTLEVNNLLSNKKITISEEEIMQIVLFAFDKNIVKIFLKDKEIKSEFLTIKHNSINEDNSQ